MAETTTTVDKKTKPKPFDVKKWVIGIIIIMAGFMFVPVFLAGPDGLERVMEDQNVSSGFGPILQWQGIIGDYLFPYIEDEFISTILAGIVGFGIMMGIVFGLFTLLKKRKKV
mgnify:CR=1 FL=1